MRKISQMFVEVGLSDSTDPNEQTDIDNKETQPLDTTEKQQQKFIDKKPSNSDYASNVDLEIETSHASQEKLNDRKSSNSDLYSHVDLEIDTSGRNPQNLMKMKQRSSLSGSSVDLDTEKTKIQEQKLNERRQSSSDTASYVHLELVNSKDKQSETMDRKSSSCKSDLRLETPKNITEIPPVVSLSASREIISSPHVTTIPLPEDADSDCVVIALEKETPKRHPDSSPELVITADEKSASPLSVSIKAEPTEDRKPLGTTLKQSSPKVLMSSSSVDKVNNVKQDEAGDQSFPDWLLTSLTGVTIFPFFEDKYDRYACTCQHQRQQTKT